MNAETGTEAGRITARALTTHEEFAEALWLQKHIWGFAENELLPIRLFVVATKVGGQVFGAFDGDRLIAFLLAIPGLRQGAKPYLHSHMLGVLPEYRNKHVGRMLKLAQRDDALARDLDLVEWTFDPLELKNAYFNLERLGAVVRRYVLNQYGITASHLHGGLPTDRCVAEWWIRAPRVERIVRGDTVERLPVRARIPVPNEIDRIRRDHPRRAREIQAGVSGQFLEQFERGLAVVGFERSETHGTYLLGDWQE